MTNPVIIGDATLYLGEGDFLRDPPYDARANSEGCYQLAIEELRKAPPS